MTLKILAAFFASSLNEFLVVLSVAFIYMFVRNFAKITFYEIFVRNFSNGFSYIKQIEFDELTMSSFNFLIWIVSIFVIIKNMYFFDIIVSKGVASIFMRPESIAGFMIAFNEGDFYGDIPRTDSQKLKVSLASGVSLVFDAFLAMFFMPILAFGLIKLFKLLAIIVAIIFGPNVFPIASSFMTKFIRVSFIFSFKFYVLSFAALLGRLIPIPFSEGFFVLFPFLPQNVINYLSELEIFGKFMVRFIFLVLFTEVLAYLVSGPLNSVDPLRLFVFLSKAL